MNMMGDLSLQVWEPFLRATGISPMAWFAKSTICKGWKGWLSKALFVILSYSQNIQSQHKGFAQVKGLQSRFTHKEATERKHAKEQ